MPIKAVYYHSPRCSKSRQGLEILEQSNYSFIVKKYLSEEMSVNEIIDIIDKLGLSHIDSMLRKKEATYKDLSINENNMTPQKWAKLIVENPIILERPLLVTNSQVIIGRPPENFIPIITNS